MKQKVFVGAAPVGESLILDFLKKAPDAEFREVKNSENEVQQFLVFLTFLIVLHI